MEATIKQTIKAKNKGLIKRQANSLIDLNGGDHLIQVK